jgi:hypothetical protein
MTNRFLILILGSLWASPSADLDQGTFDYLNGLGKLTIDVAADCRQLTLDFAQDGKEGASSASPPSHSAHGALRLVTTSRALAGPFTVALAQDSNIAVRVFEPHQSTADPAKAFISPHLVD